MNTLIVIPAYNTQSKLSILIDKILKISNLDMLILDDGSDRPLIIATESINNIKLLRNNTNQGKGSAIKTAVKYALKNNYTHIITIDSDLQHDPSKINDFYNYQENVDLVIGKRSLIAPMPIHRRFSNKVTSLIISKIIKNKIYDSQSGYRRYNMSLFSSNAFIEDGFHFESEFLLKCIDQNSIIEHIDIPTIYNDAHSSIKILQDSFKFIFLILRHCFAR